MKGVCEIKSITKFKRRKIYIVRHYEYGFALAYLSSLARGHRDYFAPPRLICSLPYLSRMTWSSSSCPWLLGLVAT